jgi:hypothetical protein
MLVPPLFVPQNAQIEYELVSAPLKVALRVAEEEEMLAAAVLVKVALAGQTVMLKLV